MSEELNTAETVFGPDAPTAEPVAGNDVVNPTITPVEPATPAEPTTTDAQTVIPAVPTKPDGTPVEPAKVVEPGTPVEPAAPVAAPIAPQPTLTPEQIADLSAAAAAKVAGAQAQPEPVPMTTEEYNQAFNVAVVTPEIVEALSNIDLPIEQRVKSLNDILQATARQAVTMALHAIKDSEKRLSENFIGQIQPLTEQMNKTESAKLISDFYGIYPDLKPYEQLLGEIHGSFVAKGIKFPTTEKAFEAVANRAKELIKGVLSSEPTPTNPATLTPETKMTTTAVGGKIGPSSGKAPPLNTAQRLWGDVVK